MLVVFNKPAHSAAILFAIITDHARLTIQVRKENQVSQSLLRTSCYVTISWHRNSPEIPFCSLMCQPANGQLFWHWYWHKKQSVLNTHPHRLCCSQLSRFAGLQSCQLNRVGGLRSYCGDKPCIWVQLSWNI